MTNTTEPKPKKLLDQVSEALRPKHYSCRTEQTFIDHQLAAPVIEFIETE